MKNMKTIALSLFLALSIMPVNAYPGENREIKKTFTAKQTVKISTITANCSVFIGKSAEINVRINYTDLGKSFKPTMEEDDDILLIREKIPASDNSNWEISVPENTNIDFSSATGSFFVKGLKSDISASTASGEIFTGVCRGRLIIKNASGDVRVEDHQGEVDIKAVSGDIIAKKLSGALRIKALSGDLKAENLEGLVDLKFTGGDIDVRDAAAAFEVSCVSGDVEATAITFKGKSAFKVVSGDIYIKLSNSLDQDLTLDSASGNAVLNYNGNKVNGYFEFRARADVGKIVSPYNFDKEEETYEYGKKYLIKSFKKGGAAPKIIIKTATGKAVLEKK